MSNVLSAQDVTDLRAAVSDLFPDRADVYHRSSPGSDEWGGSAPTYPAQPDVAQVPVLFGAQSAQELQRLGMTGEQAELILTFPGGTDVRLSDRVIVNDQGVNRTFEVYNVASGGAWEVTRPVGVREIVA